MVPIWETVAGCFALLSVIISICGITGHLKNFTKPYLQRYIVRILLMVPIYSLNAWFAMIWPVTGIYLDSLRECYESFVIYSFMKYLLNFLTYDTNLQQYIEHKPGPDNLFPFCCFPSCVGGVLFTIKCKHGILQYVLVRPLSSLLAFISQTIGFYGEGDLNPLSGNSYPILLLVNNISQLIAMYSLLIFYTGYKQELRPMNPIGKFLSIKLVIFFTFFMQVIITGLLEFDFFYEMAAQLFPHLQNKVFLGKKLQELLICFAMLLAAIYHQFSFSHKPYIEDNGNLINDSQVEAQSGGLISPDYGNVGQYNDRDVNDGLPTCCSAFVNLFDFGDERADFTETFIQASEQVRLLFQRQQRLPVVVSRQPSIVSWPEAASEADAEAQSANKQIDSRHDTNNDEPSANKMDYKSLK